VVRFDRRVDVTDFLDEAAARRLPVVLVDADAPPDAVAFSHPLLIVRADQHVAWRGDRLTAVDVLIDRLRGVAS